jgi:molybdenum cofactor biosynthesis enzyme MoaA
MVRADAQPTPRIRSALIQILKQCNFRCGHCSQSAPFIGNELAAPVSLEDVRLRIDALKSRGLERVRFTGGEPLLHPEVAEIIKYAQDRGVSTSLVTNGSLLLGRAGDLRAAGLEAAWISLYGSTAVGYRAVAGVSPSIGRLSAAIRELSSGGVRVGLYCVADLATGALETSLLTSLIPHGVAHVKFLQLMEQGRGMALAPSSLDLSEKALREIVALRRAHPDTDISVSMRSTQAPTFRAFGFSLPAHMGCTAGTEDAWSMGVEGHLTPCCLMMSPGESATRKGPKALPLLSQANLRRTVGSALSCPALPDYPHASPDDFVCPLMYARI